MSKLNNLPDMNDTIVISQEQQQSYRRDGHAMIRGLMRQDEVSSYRNLISDIVREHNYHTKPLHERDTYGKAFIQVGNLWKLNPIAEKFVLARRFAKVAADLMGVSGVRIYHDQALFKEPGGGHTPWHQDQIYWPLNTNHTITLWMPLVPVPAEVGSMRFVSGTHHNGYISKQEISDESHKTFKDYIEGKGLEQIDYGALDAGDATFHSGWTLHSAPGNPTANMREVMTIIYVADGTIISEPDSNARKNDLAQWLPGLRPGDIAASPLNPLVYP
ncbi:phytanoyl-CoA dioxygenase family protein [Paenibacillus glycanilyticus]|uniref:Phytanoyl-CoA dioxygenase n=1 Tax=Paenibacillus glycanilyticus TaxID=126569 RepID=A0ABQ6GMF6_9BACL|nr:phytanoyl-CoA dioxygenase family protein [Paenibacillus glycanilyticus]GLX70821.1 phytanoyl-CoA dioxygenase [Paenibacillus glycanilyticus]